MQWNNKKSMNLESNGLFKGFTSAWICSDRSKS